MRRSLVFQQQYYADDGMWMQETQAQQQGHAFHEESWSSDNKRFPAAMHINKFAAFAVDSDGLSMSKQQRGKLGGMHMKRLGDFALDSELSMSKQHGKLGGMHMSILGDFAMDSEVSMSKQQHGKLGGMNMNMNRHGANFTTDSHLLMSKQHGKLGGSYGNMFQEGMHSGHHIHGGGRKFPFGANNNASHHFSNGGGGKHEYLSVSEETEYEEAYTEEHVGAITAKVEEMRYQHHNWGSGDTCYGRNKIRNKNWRTAKGI